MAMGVSVFGLGYVGCVSAACFAREGFEVIGVDVNPAKVARLNQGLATILESGISELVADGVAAGRLRATTSVEEAVHASTVSLVCVGTPSRPNGGIDLGYIERVCEQIGAVLREKAARHVVVIRSTVLPGTIHEVVVPALERTSGKRLGEGFGVASNPEFLREGSSVKDFYEPPFTVIGADSAPTAEVLGSLYRGIEAPVHVVDVRVAETLKYACNCFHGVKVAFANEIGSFCREVGVDSHEVMRLFCEDRKLNISTAYLRPGFAFGGSCLPKDLRALTHRARQLDVDLPLLAGTLESNRRLIDRVVEMILATGARRVGLLGITFKAGTDDLRESPMITVAERLIGKGVRLAIYDRDASEAGVTGANREYVEREIPHIWSMMRPTIEQVLAESDVIVIGNGTKAFREAEAAVREGQVVIDLVRAFGARRSDDDGYRGLAW
jgi:GDP-mannose 6-dehydrogenase